MKGTDQRVRAAGYMLEAYPQATKVSIRNPPVSILKNFACFRDIMEECDLMKNFLYVAEQLVDGGIAIWVTDYTESPTTLGSQSIRSCRNCHRLNLCGTATGLLASTFTNKRIRAYVYEETITKCTERSIEWPTSVVSTQASSKASASPRTSPSSQFYSCLLPLRNSSIKKVSKLFSD